MKFKMLHIPPSNFLVHRGEQIECIYFVARGYLEVLTEETTIVILGAQHTTPLAHPVSGFFAICFAVIVITPN